VEGHPCGDPDDRQPVHLIEPRTERLVPGGGGDDPDGMPGGCLSTRESLHLGLDATGAGREAIGDVGYAHAGTLRHVPARPVRHHNVTMHTLVFCHAHPDDEALLTAGTMAKAAAAGHRVILVVATDGAAGLASSRIEDLVAVRRRELEVSARILGVHRIEFLGYTDSGLVGDTPDAFAATEVDAVAARVRAVVVAEDADIVVGYDPSGGYGHRDHIHLHRVVRAGVEGTAARLFEATLPREPIAWAVRTAARLRLTPRDFDPREFDQAWTPRAHITHRVNVRAQFPAKRAALAAHASQASTDSGLRTLQVLNGLPGPIARALLAAEYYVEVTSLATSTSSPGAS